MTDENDGLDRLPASEPVQGGLSLPTRSSSSSSTRPSGRSLLGLDELAKRKRAEGGRGSRPVKKRMRSSSIQAERDEDDDDYYRTRPSRSVQSSGGSAPNNTNLHSSSRRVNRSGGGRTHFNSRKDTEPSKESTRFDPKRQRNRTWTETPKEPTEKPSWDTAKARAEYDLEQERIEREWYLGEEIDNAARSLPSGIDDNAIAQRQAKRLSEKAAARHADARRWEKRQMGFGMYAARGPREDEGPVDDEDGKRVTVLVKEVLPKFLQAEKNLLGDRLPSLSDSKSVVVGDRITMPVKDSTSDLAVMARQGSALVQEFREKRERGAKRTKYWELGSAAGAKAKESAEQDAEREAKEQIPAERNDDDWKKDMKFGDAMKRKQENPDENDAEKVETKTVKKTVKEIRRSLPVFKVRDELMRVIRDNQVVIVVGETGSGKTTQLTQYLHEEGYARHGIIGCTQPRRVAAVSVAQRVAEEFMGGSELGEQVGYSIRFEDCTSKDTVIKYMTDGILLRETLSDPEVDKYSVIVMDEAHERSLNTDVLFGVLRTVLTKRMDIKVIVTSATLDADKFSRFFGNAPVFKIPGRTHPVDIFHRRSPSMDYVQDAVFQVMQIHLKASVPGDILVFMSGQEDIETTCESLAEKLSKLENPRPLLILPIYSQLAADLQAKIFDPAPKGARKVVVASNIAETSLTIEGIKYVVDSGFCKLKTYNPRLGMDALLLCPIAQSSAMQRAGRAGRTGPGKCYRLFTAPAFQLEMLQTNVPEIQRTNLGHVVLLLKSLGVSDLLDFPFLDPPPAENILKSMLGLWLLGALDTEGNLTELGKRMSVFPLDPALSALLFIGEKHRCLIEAVTIVAMLSVPNVFVRPHGREEESDSAREKFFVPESDHLTLLHVYQRWRAAGSRSDWCMKHFINWKGMRKAREVREQLLELTKSQRMTQTSSDDWDVIRRAIASAYYYQAARRKGIGEYINIRSGVACGLHPTSAIYGTGLSPEYVIYHELIYTKKEYMSCVTSVEPQWLAESGPLLYILRTVGDTGLEAAMSLQRRRAMAANSVQPMAGRESGAQPNFLEAGDRVRPSSARLPRSRQTIAGPGFGKKFKRGR